MWHIHVDFHPADNHVEHERNLTHHDAT